MRACITSLWAPVTRHFQSKESFDLEARLDRRIACEHLDARLPRHFLPAHVHREPRHHVLCARTDASHSHVTISSRFSLQLCAHHHLPSSHNGSARTKRYVMPDTAERAHTDCDLPVTSRHLVLLSSPPFLLSSFPPRHRASPVLAPSRPPANSPCAAPPAAVGAPCRQLHHALSRQEVVANRALPRRERVAKPHRTCFAFASRQFHNPGR